MAKPEVNEELAAALKQAKNRRMYFAFVVKGGTDGALVISKQKIPPAEIAEAKKKCGGSTVIKGACFGEDGKLVFETAKEPAGTLGNAIKLVARRDTGLTIAPVCRVGTAADLSDDEAAPEKPAAQASATAADHAAGNQATVYKQRLAAITPDLKAGLAAGGESAAQLKTEFAVAQALAAKNDYAAAIGKLDLIAAELHKSHATATPGAAKDGAVNDATASGDRRADLVHRLNALAGDLKAAIAGKSPQAAKLPAQVAKLNGLIKDGDFDQADTELGALEDLLADAELASLSAGIPKGSKLTPIWQKARDTVGQQIGALGDKLEKSKDPQLVRISKFGLNGITKKLQVGLQVALMNYDGAAGPAKDSARGKLQPLLQQYQTFVESDPVLKLLDNNPFGVSVTIKTTLGKALRQISLAAAP